MNCAEGARIRASFWRVVSRDGEEGENRVVYESRVMDGLRWGGMDGMEWNGRTIDC